jgi:hypothetical protein
MNTLWYVFEAWVPFMRPSPPRSPAPWTSGLGLLGLLTS